MGFLANVLVITGIGLILLGSLGMVIKNQKRIIELLEEIAEKD